MAKEVVKAAKQVKGNLALQYISSLNLYAIICTSTTDKDGRYVFLLEGKNYSAIAICPDIDWAIKTCQASRDSGMGGDNLLGLVSFAETKNFRQYSAKDSYEFICWLSF